MKMALKLSQSLEEQVTCPICLYQYQDPRILPCLHTYCRKCLEDLLDKGSNRFSIQCPECRETFQIENVTSLKVNIWVNRINIALELSKVEDQKGEAVLMCDNDNCNSKGQAEARCFDCEIFMCASCIKAHHLLSKLTKDHHLMTLEDIKEKGVPPMEKLALCDKHKGKKQKLFCQKCDTLICKDCTLVDHAGHKFAFIADVVEKQRGQLQKKMQHACGIKKKIKSALKTVKDMQERVRKNEKNIKREIDEKIDVQIAILEEMRAKLKQESTNLTATKIKKLSLQQDGLEMQLASLKSAVEFTENILAKGSNNDVLSMKKQIEWRLTELSDKEIDDEVDEEDKQILQVNEISCNDLENYVVIKDRFAPDQEKSTVGWTEGTSNICLQVRNNFGEPINIKTNRVQIDCSGIHVKCTKTNGKNGEHLIESSNVVFERPLDLNQDGSTLEELKNLNVLVDGLPVQGSPLKFIANKRISPLKKLKYLFR